MRILWLFPLGALVMTLAGAGLLVNGARRTRSWRRFVARAQVARAEVVDLRRRTVRASDGPTRHSVLVPVVRFTTADGAMVQAPVQYVTVTAGVRPGDRLDVRYDPHDPHRVNAADGPAQGSTFGCAQLALGIGLVVLGTVGTVALTALALAITG